MTPAGLSPTRLLEIEDSDELLSHVCPRSGVPLWAMIRWDVLDGLLRWTWADADTASRPSRVTRRRRARHLISATRVNTTIVARGAEASLLVVGNSAVRTLTRNGTQFNPLTDYLAGAVPSSGVMEIPDLVNGRDGRPGVLDQDPMRTASRLVGRARRRSIAPAAQDLVEWIRLRTSDLLGLEVPTSYLMRWARLCAESTASLPFYEAMWSALLRRLDVKVVIKVDGSYGGPENVALLRAARQLGVLVAEHQHGVVTRAHMAYNCAPALARSAAYAATRPPVILTYGPWWHRAFNTPSRLVPMGNPHRQAMAPSLTTERDSRTEVLFLGNSIDTVESLAFCVDLCHRVPDGTPVTFRPHPGERQRAKELARSPHLGRVQLDLSDDLYSAFGRARVVVAEASTGLYEAVSLVPKIFVWGNAKGLAFSADAPFDVVSDGGELASAITEPSRGAPPPGLDDAMWAPDWRARFAEFAGDNGVSLG